MRIIGLTTQKGGAGKTTLAASLAIAAQLDGESVYLLDLDPQASLWSWGQRRNRAAPIVHKAAAADLGRLLANARHSYSLAIIDTPGQVGGDVSLTLPEIDLCLLPVKPSLLDVEAAKPTVDQLRRLKQAFAFVLNQCAPSSQARTLDAATLLVRSGALAPSMVATRTDFLDAITAGMGVTEFNPKGKATQEIALLWQWTKNRLKEIGNGKS